MENMKIGKIFYTEMSKLSKRRQRPKESKQERRKINSSGDPEIEVGSNHKDR